MPLVPPGIMSPMGDKEEWANKLMGKKPGDSTNATVCILSFLSFEGG